MSARATFSLRVSAAAPCHSEQYRDGQRCELVVIVRETPLDQALAVAREAIAAAGWLEPDFHAIAQLPGRLTLAKLRQLNRMPGVAAAIRHGRTVIVFPTCRDQPPHNQPDGPVGL